MKNKKITLKEKKKMWDKFINESTPQEYKNEGTKIVQDFIFNTIVNAPIMPDLKPLNEDEINEE